MTTIRIRLRAPTVALLALTALCLGGAASARQTAPVAPPAAPLAASLDKPFWKELSRPQQIALEPLAGEWDAMEGVRKQKWLEIANRYSSMKPDEQLRVQERMRAWIKLTPDERRMVRENYTLSKKLDKEQKSAKWEQYQQLPEEEKRKLAAEAATKKGATNLPSKSQPKAVAPVKNVPATTPAPGNPATPVPNVK